MSDTSSLDAFPHTWSVQVLRTPPLIAPARQFVYPQNIPGEEDALNRGALLLSVRPATGGSFLATCALGFRDPSLPSGVWSCPSEHHLLAVAGGYAYRVDTLHPGTAELLEQRPVTALLPAPEHGLILLAGFHDLLALGKDGVLWRSARLSWEGITLGQIHGQHLHGTGWGHVRRCRPALRRRSPHRNARGRRLSGLRLAVFGAHAVKAQRRVALFQHATSLQHAERRRQRASLGMLRNYQGPRRKQGLVLLG